MFLPMIHPAQLALVFVSIQFMFATDKNIEVFEFDKSDSKTSQLGNKIEGATLLGTIPIDDEKKGRVLLNEMTKNKWHNWERHTTLRGSTFHRYEVYLYNPAEKKFSLNLKDDISYWQKTIKEIFDSHLAVVVMPRNPWNY